MKPWEEYALQPQAQQPPPMRGPWDDYAPDAVAQAPTAAQKPSPSDSFSMRLAKEAWPYIEDVGKSAGVGLIKGATGLVGLPGGLKDAVGAGVDWLGDKAIAGLQNVGAISSQTADTIKSRAQEARNKGDPYDYLPRQADVNAGIEKITGPLYKPQTTPGEYAQTMGEFVPSALIMPGSAGMNLLNNAFLAGGASETAGQATKGTALEPYARIGAAMLGGTAGSIASGPSTYERMAGRAAQGISDQQYQAAEILMRSAKAKGITLTVDEALNAATNGATKMGDLRRIVESTPDGGGMLAQAMAERPAQMTAAGRDVMDQIAPRSASPTLMAGQLQEGAQKAMAASPEGQALQQSIWAAGPRTTPEQAGAIMQPELRNIYDKREGMRAALADRDYAAARDAPATVPLDGGFGFRDVTHHYDGPDIPILTNAGERRDAIAKLMAERNVTEKMPVIGLEPTKFGQVDVAPVAKMLDAQLETAKGPVKQALGAAKSALIKPDGSLDNSVAGLHSSREAITDLISQAQRAGAPSAVRELQGVLGTLDQALERVPAYGQARRGFKAASDPLGPFENGSLASTIERDQYNQRFTMPPERVPMQIEANGPSAARDLNSVAPGGPAQDAYRNYLTTKLLDSATDAQGRVSADALKMTLRNNQDVLAQFPDVEARLSQVLKSRDAMSSIERSLVGRLADTSGGKQQADMLMPKAPLPGSENETAQAVKMLMDHAPDATRGTVRSGIERAFNRTVAGTDTMGRPDQFGGAKFAAAMRGDPQRYDNITAALTGAAGPQTAQNMGDLLNVLGATGWRQRPGSATAFNTEALNEMKTGGLQGAAQWGAKPFAKVQEAMGRARLGSQTEDLAQLLLSGPDGIARVQQLAAQGDGAAKFMLRLAAAAQQGS